MEHHETNGNHVTENADRTLVTSRTPVEYCGNINEHKKIIVIVSQTPVKNYRLFILGERLF
jgi:hypothetical protein